MQNFPNVDVSPTWFVAPILVIVTVGIVVLLSHFVFRGRYHLAEVARKVVHVASGVAFAVGSYSMTREQMLLACAAMGAALVAVSALRLPLVMERVPRVTVGAAAFPLGLAVSTVLFYSNPTAFRISVLALGTCDAVAALVGTYLPLGGFKVLGQRKSISGMVGCFVAATVLAISFGASPFTALGFGLAIASIEAIFVFGLDNLFVPVIAGFLYSIF